MFAFVCILLFSSGNVILSHDAVPGTSEHAFDHKKMYNNLHVLHYSMHVQVNKNVHFYGSY